MSSFARLRSRWRASVSSPSYLNAVYLISAASLFWPDLSASFAPSTACSSFVFSCFEGEFSSSYFTTLWEIWPARIVAQSRMHYFTFPRTDSKSFSLAKGKKFLRGRKLQGMGSPNLPYGRTMLSASLTASKIALLWMWSDSDNSSERFESTAKSWSSAAASLIYCSASRMIFSLAFSRVRYSWTFKMLDRVLDRSAVGSFWLELPVWFPGYTSPYFCILASTTRGFL